MRTVVLTALLLTSCATPGAGDSLPLSRAQVVDVLKKPMKWHDREVLIRIWPFDDGLSHDSYIVCLERCSREEAQHSAMVLHAKDDRFAGARGRSSVIVSVRIDGDPSCFEQAICVRHRWPIKLYEEERPLL